MQPERPWYLVVVSGVSLLVTIAWVALSLAGVSGTAYWIAWTVVLVVMAGGLVLGWREIRRNRLR
jgi:hypothetical protein